MPTGRRQRKVLWGLGFALGGFLVLWFSMPLWFPWVLRPVARRAGAHYARYEREGYGRFALFGVGFTNQAIRFHAEQIDALVPNVWLWRCAFARGTPQPFLSVERWQYESVPSAKPGGSAYTQAREWAARFKTLRRWLPTAVFTNGTVRLQKTAVPVPALTWARGNLRAKVTLPHVEQPVMLDATPGQAPLYTLQIRSDSLHLESAVRLFSSASGLDLQSTSRWWGNRIDLQAQFERSGNLPVSASLQAQDFRLPAEVVRLWHYAEMKGSIRAKWDRGEFALDLNAGAHPLAAQTNLPPIKVDLHARGDTNSATIQTATLSAPWLKAELSRELSLHFHGPLLRQPATLKLAADLSRQPWLPLQGSLNGAVEFRPSAGKYPAARFRFAGANLGHARLQATAFTLEGGLDWPWLEISKADAAFADSSSATVAGRMDLEKKEFAEGRFHFSGALVQRWLPPGYSCQNLSCAGSFSGPLKEILHRGHLEASRFTSPYLRPLELRADWSGRQKNLDQAEILASAGNSSLRVRGALAAASTQADFQLAALSLRTNGQPMMELTQPCGVSVARSTSGHNWRISMTPFDWAGTGGQVNLQASLNWPRQGDLRLALRQLPSALLAGFSKTELPSVEIQNLSASAGWSNGPASFALDLSAKGLAPAAGAVGQASRPPPKPPSGIPLIAKLKLTGDQNGIVLSNLVVASPTSDVAVAEGFLPLTFQPGAPADFVHLDAEKPLRLRATAQPQAFFWNKLADWTGILLREPSLKMNLTGTWPAPHGEVDLRAQAFQLRKTRFPMPSLEGLRLVVQLDSQQARLTEGQLLVQGQPVSLTGEIPLDKNFWAGLKAKKLPDWTKARARLRMPEVELAAFEPLFPALLSPQGELNADLSLLPGGKLDGTLAVHHARTRPLGNLGPVRDIELKVRLLDRTLKLENATADLSGAAITLTGQADLRGTNWLTGTLPPLSFALRGTDVPLARQPNLIVRSDLNLAVAKTNGAPPLISGIARLKNSYFLSDLQALIPGRVAVPSQRPPYFSIEDPLLADWRLALQVSGVRFLKVRSPIFNGEVSANLRLQGTLKDPIALGDVKTDSGVVSFPFASLQVQQGLVTLTSQDPYRPKLAVTATSKQFGYDIHMEVTGPVDVPVIQFSSTPPLSSEQILLMVTAGEMPQGTFTLSSQQRAQTVAMFFGRDLLARLGLGDQAQQRLTIRSGEQISEQGRPTYHVEYKLTDRWSLEGEYDRFGSFNAGFKWRVYSK